MYRYKVVDRHFANLWYWPTFLVFSALSKTRLYRGGAYCTALLLRLTLNLEETLSSNKITDDYKSIQFNFELNIFNWLQFIFSQLEFKVTLNIFLCSWLDFKQSSIEIPTSYYFLLNWHKCRSKFPDFKLIPMVPQLVTHTRNIASSFLN